VCARDFVAASWLGKHHGAVLERGFSGFCSDFAVAFLRRFL
jgi:hypothetical protein